MRRVLLLLLVLTVVALMSGGAVLAEDTQVRQWASDTASSSEYGASDCTNDWCLLDATGQPDTLACGDIPTAWSPRSSGPNPEWLEVVFATPVYATGVEVYESFNTGFVTRIDLIDVTGRLQVIWEGSDATPCPGVLEVSFPQTSLLVDRVRVHTQIDGWELIDTVKLMGNDAQSTYVEQWPFDATATSSWGGEWAASQAEAPPNTFDCGDIETAWAPLSSGSDPEWLEVYYLKPVHAQQIVIYETNEQGFVYQVDLIDTGGLYHTVWTGLDVTTCPGQFTLSFDTTPFLVVGARIHTQINGWEEIDAVELIGVAEPADAIRELVAAVETLNIGNGISNALDAKLDNAVKALEDVNENNNVAAINKLQAFINEVEAQAGNMISQADADALIVAAQAIISMLGG